MLQPDANSRDFETFYDRIGAAQLEERYIAENEYAVARIHLVLDWLLPVARRGGRLLDIGCASGYYSVAFARAGGYATGVDISEASVKIAQRRAKAEGVADRCEFLHGDMRSLPIDDRRYDAVVMVEVLEHVREQKDAVAEAIRALRPGGILVLTTPHALDELPPWKRLLHVRAATPEAAGVSVKRLDTNKLVAASGIDHAPYFHDAFTFSQIRKLVPPDAEVVRLHSLYTVAPGVLAGHVPTRIRRWAKRALSRGRGGATPPLAAQTPVKAAGEQPVTLPPVGGAALVMMTGSRLMWRLPVVRLACRHHLLVARRRR